MQRAAHSDAASSREHTYKLNDFERDRPSRRRRTTFEKGRLWIENSHIFRQEKFGLVLGGAAGCGR